LEYGFATKARAVALRDFGPAMAPMNAFLTLTGIETLPLRMERHVANARKVAEFQDGHPRVAWVSYAGLANSPYRALAEKYLPAGAGSVFTFRVKGGFEAGARVVEAVRLFSHLANVGDTRSLILHPASTTHRQLSDEQRVAAGAGPDVIRLSVGLGNRRRPHPRSGHGSGGGVTVLCVKCRTGLRSRPKQQFKVVATWAGSSPHVAILIDEVRRSLRFRRSP